MKILIDARMYGLEHSGIGRYLINLIEELKNPSTSLRTSLKTDFQFIILIRKKYFDLLKFPANWKKVLADFRHYTFEEQFKIPGIIKNERPDLVHFPHINYPIFFTGKHVITVHDLTMQHQGTNATQLPLLIYYLKRLPFLLAARIGIKSASAIITPSNTVKNDVSEYYKTGKNKIFVTHEGISSLINDHQPLITDKKLLRKYKLADPYFFYVGNAYPHKNLGIVVKAIKKLNEGERVNILFAIAGAKDVFNERLESLTEKENVQEFVKLLGYVPDEHLKALYKNSVAFVYPSLSEGFGLQGLEAMAAGSLVLASDIPVFREIYEDNALYFDSKDANSLVEVMKKMMKMSHADKLARLNKAKEFIKRYSWQKMAKETLAIYKDVLRRS